MYHPVLWIQIHWTWIRIQDFGPIWSRIQDFGPFWIRIQVRIWIQRYAIKFRGKIKNNNFREEHFSLKKVYFFKTIRTKCHLKKIILVSWVCELWIYILHLIPFVSILSFTGIYMSGSGSVCGIRIRIHKAYEYGSNTDPDPQHWITCHLSENQGCGSGFAFIKIKF